MTKRLSQDMASRHATPKKSKRKTKQVLRPAQQFNTASFLRESDERPKPQSTSSFTSAPRTRFRSTVQALSSDYHYVVSDLRRIAITAAALVVIMVVLTFVIK